MSWPTTGSTNAFTTAQKALSTTAAEVVARRPRRRRVTLLNLDESITVYFGPASPTVTASNGMRLLAGESIGLETSEAVHMIAASGTPSVAITEEFQR